MTVSEITVGTQVMVHTRISYRQYVLPASAMGNVVTIDEFGDCRVAWWALGTKWLLRQSLRSIYVHDSEGNWTAFCPDCDENLGDDEHGSVQNERIPPFPRSSGRVLPATNSSGCGTCMAALENAAEPRIINLFVPGDVSRKGDKPLGLILDNETGDIRVMEVVPDSWGARSGVIAGDIVVELNGQPICCAAAEAVERLGKLRPLAIKVLRRHSSLHTSSSEDILSDLLAQVNACESRANVAEGSLVTARQTPFSYEDLANLLASHCARAVNAEHRATQFERRANFLVAKMKHQPKPRSSGDAVIPDDNVIESNAVKIGFPNMPNVSLNARRESEEEIAVPVPDFAVERVPEPCCRCSTSASCS